MKKREAQKYTAQLKVTQRPAWLGIYPNGQVAGLRFKGSEISTFFVFPSRKAARVAKRELNKRGKHGNFRIVASRLQWTEMTKPVPDAPEEE